jgi:hypothetical protein
MPDERDSGRSLVELAVKTAMSMNQVFDPPIDIDSGLNSILAGIGAHAKDLCRDDPLLREEWGFLKRKFGVDRDDLPCKADVDGDYGEPVNKIVVPETIEEAPPVKVPRSLSRAKQKKEIEYVEAAPGEETEIRAKKRGYVLHRPMAPREKAGVGKAIVRCLMKGRRRGVTKMEIWERLREKFPDRDPWALITTLNTTVPGALNRNGKNRVEELENGRFRLFADDDVSE